MSAAVDTRVRAAVHWRVEHPFAADKPMAAQVDLAGRLCGEQLARTCAETDFDPQAFVVVSTVMSHAISMAADGHERFHAAIERACGRRPEGLLNAYMCTGWAFALRHFLRHTAVRRLAIAIVDLDVHNLAWQRHHPVIGRSGFGVTTLLLELPDDRGHGPTCAGPFANSAFSEFVMALKAQQSRQGACPTFIPFMQGSLATTAQRLLAKGSLGPDRHADLGHCFGADPWISLIEWAGTQPPAGDCRVVAGAIAFNGYYGFAPLVVGPDLHVALRRLDGDAASLEQHLAGAPNVTPAHLSSSLESVDA